MNKDKAIQLLERLQDPEPYEPMLTKDAYDAIQMAIDALSADGDTISRKAAIEAINHELRCGAVIDQCGLETAHDLIEELPPAQPEIIRCKDCRFSDSDATCCLVCCRDGQGLKFAHVRADNFCSYAERRTDE